MIEESKYCNDVMKKYFNKELVMTKEDNENFGNSTKFSTCNNDSIVGDVKVRDHYNIIGKYRGSAHIDCNFNVKLKYEIPMAFHNLKNYDPNLVI